MSTPGWTLRTVTEAFLEMEDELDLLRGAMGLTWEAARFSLHQRLMVALGAVGQGQVFHGDLEPSRLRRGWAYARNAVVRPSLAAGPAELLFVGHPRRRRLPDGTWTDLYVDPLLRGLGPGIRAGVVEPPHLGVHRHPPTVSGVRYLDDVVLLGAAVGALGAGRATASEKSAMDAVARKVRRRFDVEVGVADRLEEARFLRATGLRFYRALLDRVSPKLLVVVCAYGLETLIEAAKARDVPVVELQHGVIYPYHLGYTYPTVPKSTFPDHLLTFGSFWNDATDYPVPAERIHAVGYPVFDEARASMQRDPGDEVLFVSQLAVGEPLSRMAVDFASRTGRPVIYKLHPGEIPGWRERYPWLTAPDVRVVDDPGRSIYELFATARAQVGVFSTALYEGIGLGVPTVVAELPGSEASEPLVRRGYAGKAADVTGLEAALNRPTAPADAEALFRPGAVARATTLLREMAGV